MRCRSGPGEISMISTLVIPKNDGYCEDVGMVPCTLHAPMWMSLTFFWSSVHVMPTQVQKFLFGQSSGSLHQLSAQPFFQPSVGAVAL